MKKYTNTFILLSKKFTENSRMKPTQSETAELIDAGIGEQTVNLQEDDDAARVLLKLGQ